MVPVTICAERLGRAVGAGSQVGLALVLVRIRRADLRPDGCPTQRGAAPLDAVLRGRDRPGRAAGQRNREEPLAALRGRGRGDLAEGDRVGRNGRIRDIAGVGHAGDVPGLQRRELRDDQAGPLAAVGRAVREHPVVRADLRLGDRRERFLLREIRSRAGPRGRSDRRGSPATVRPSGSPRSAPTGRRSPPATVRRIRPAEHAVRRRACWSPSVMVVVPASSLPRVTRYFGSAVTTCCPSTGCFSNFVQVGGPPGLPEVLGGVPAVDPGVDGVPLGGCGLVGDDAPDGLGRGALSGDDEHELTSSASEASAAARPATRRCTGATYVVLESGVQVHWIRGRCS